MHQSTASNESDQFGGRKEAIPLPGPRPTLELFPWFPGRTLTLTLSISTPMPLVLYVVLPVVSVGKPRTGRKNSQRVVSHKRTLPCGRQCHRPPPVSSPSTLMNRLPISRSGGAVQQETGRSPTSPLTARSRVCRPAAVEWCRLCGFQRPN